MSKRFKLVTIAAAIFVALFATLAATPALALSGEESQFVSSHNSIRGEHGRASLALYSDLVDIARRHSQEMAAKGSIWHNPRLGSEVKGWDVVGENVGMGPSVPDLMDAFMNSPAHRSNILDPDYNQFGIGVAISDGTIYVTVVFAHRGGSVQTSTPRTTTTRRSTVTRTRSVRAPAPQAQAPSTAAAPAPVVPAPAVPTTRSVSMLVRIVGLDAN